jgi:hypothetical protein
MIRTRRKLRAASETAIFAMMEFSWQPLLNEN